ncbi:hypothetical protein M413DRAFT_151442 [Hebeloma cylindrosporum]|uniref:Hemerythrin-like domain-containing protein n=1 Tax=Hebeloma cylindrosporum TaxID=76867 RepID=A0A0C2YKM0_HEBCY|nr:hypothetical protein M413DRAFT_151442 [Hebeloma cylindrosporum h7]
MSSEEPWELISALPSIPFVQTLASDIQGLFAADMSLIHNVFIRGLNSIWRNAPLVKPNDVGAFAGYSLTCMNAIQQHHHGEETLIFPYLQTKLDMAHNIEQHEGFHAGMDAFEEYMKKVQTNEETFDAEKTRELLKAFADPLVQHLHEEISTLSPGRMKAFDDDQEGVKNMYQQLEEHIKTQPGKLTVFPFVMSHHDPKLAPNWPPAPAPILWFSRNIAPWRHRSYWKFSPFTSHGVPQVYTA